MLFEGKVMSENGFERKDYVLILLGLGLKFKILK